jgi:hypothetical protein
MIDMVSDKDKVSRDTKICHDLLGTMTTSRQLSGERWTAVPLESAQCSQVLLLPLLTI